jgi:hypothetical protein
VSLLAKKNRFKSFQNQQSQQRHKDQHKSSIEESSWFEGSVKKTLFEWLNNSNASESAEFGFDQPNCF